MNIARSTPLRALALAAAVLLAAIAIRQARNTFAAGDPPWHEELDVVYGQGGDENLKLDLYTPQTPGEPAPAIVFIHGGGWRQGTKQDFRGFCQAFAKVGYVAVTVDYRLAPEHRFPAQINDVKCAVRWLKANAQRLHVDPDRIAAVGSSAGAHLSLLLGFTNDQDGLEGAGGSSDQTSRVCAVINISGPTDLTMADWPAAVETMLEDFLGGKQSQAPEAYRRASPLNYLRADAPPVLTWHGSKDPLVPYKQATMLDAAMTKIGASSQLETISGKGHGDDWSETDWTRVVLGSMAFLGQQFKKP